MQNIMIFKVGVSAKLHIHDEQDDATGCDCACARYDGSPSDIRAARPSGDGGFYEGVHGRGDKNAIAGYRHLDRRILKAREGARDCIDIRKPRKRGKTEQAIAAEMPSREA
jgi:hypothetical protein